MTTDMVQRARVVMFAYNEARHTGSLDCMKAVVYVLKNRIRAGWGSGTWLNAIQGHEAVAGTDPQPDQMFDVQDRLLQMFARDIDDIYLSSSFGDDNTKLVVGEALYYQFIDKPTRGWFLENIVREPKLHPRTGQIGTMALFGNPPKVEKR